MKKKSTSRRGGHKVKFGPLLTSDDDSGSDEAGARGVEEGTLVELDIADPEPLLLQPPLVVERPLTSADFTWKAWVLSFVCLLALLTILFVFLVVPTINTARLITSGHVMADVNASATANVTMDNLTTSLPVGGGDFSVSVSAAAATALPLDVSGSSIPSATRHGDKSTDITESLTDPPQRSTTASMQNGRAPNDTVLAETVSREAPPVWPTSPGFTDSVNQSDVTTSRMSVTSQPPGNVTEGNTH